MTLVWHDWFATSNTGVDSQRLMLDQNQLFRRFALGNFRFLLHSTSRADPAMLLWLYGTPTTRWARRTRTTRASCMELFTLGAGSGYAERDVREQARALTGFRNDWADGSGPDPLPLRPDAARRRRRSDLRQARARSAGSDACDLCLAHPAHPRFFVEKLWSYFIPVPPSPPTASALEAHLPRGLRGAAGARGDPRHPALYDAARAMVKPPVVYTAGMLRALGRRIDTTPGLAVRRRRPVPLPPAERGGLGRHALARHRDVPRPLADRATPLRGSRSTQKRGHKPRRRRAGRGDRRRRGLLLGSPRSGADEGRARAVRRRHLGRRRGLEADAYPPLALNALRMLLAMSPDY